MEGLGEPGPQQGHEGRDQRDAALRRVTGPSTRQHIKATLRAALNDAIGRQIITFNPAAHVEIDPVRKPKALVWTDERVARWQQTGEKPSPVMVWTPEPTGAFLDFVAEDRLYAMWHLIAFRGLRRGEACGRPWSETNLDRHSLTVTGQLVQDGWEVEASEPKTDSGFRVVALDDDTVDVLEWHRKQQEADRAEWGCAWIETGLVFTQEDGSWLHPGKVTDLFERLVAASGTAWPRSCSPLTSTSRSCRTLSGTATPALRGTSTRVSSPTSARTPPRRRSGERPGQEQEEG